MSAVPARGESVVSITVGEPAGIGPDLCVSLALSPPAGARLLLLGDAMVLEARARALGAAVSFDRLGADDPVPAARPGHLPVLHVPVAAPVRAGMLDTANASHVLQLIDTAVDGCLSGRQAAMVTCPVHKGVINDAGIAFTGHTERLAERTGTDRVVMMLSGGGMRVALATTHLPLAAVPAAITPALLDATLAVMHAALRRDFGIDSPRILVAGLNPHAGEGGHLGREEIETIGPALARARALGIDARGPLPADTLFNPDRLAEADAVLAMYHDQGLPVLKHASFGRGVNITLGMPIVRTSVDHGTALDLAGSGRADPGSLREAVVEAIAIARRRAHP